MVQQKHSIFYIFLKKCKKPRKTWKIRGCMTGGSKASVKKFTKSGNSFLYKQCIM